MSRTEAVVCRIMQKDKVRLKSEIKLGHDLLLLRDDRVGDDVGNGW